MITCDVCGSENFEKHAGYMYCVVCQTQSQDYQEQEYDFRDHEINTIRTKKSASKSKKRKQHKFYDDGMWTTWDAFNHILFGMTQEMKKCGVTNEFERMVLKLWAAYLHACEALFICGTEEKLPKLGFNFKPRDAMILYNIDASNVFKERRPRRSSCRSRTSCTSNSSFSLQSKRSVALQKGRIIAADYRDLLSVSLHSSNNLADETLESLGKSSEGEETTDISDSEKSTMSSFKKIIRQKDYKLCKEMQDSKDAVLQSNAKATFKKNIRCPGKNKLLSIIHLALLMTKSQIQLSDLLRFIREGHLSFAKVTHFFPREVKLPKTDFTYIEVTSDSLMPTHLNQRKITNQLAYLLKVDQIQTPNMNQLVDRYCQELNLPEDIAHFSKNILIDDLPSSVPSRGSTTAVLPSFEAWAMSSIIFVMKLLFGLNDSTEIFLSRLAREINKSHNEEQPLFVFEDWQKYIECRKTVLSEFHYPTMEQLNGRSFESSQKFLAAMMKESKDEYRNERFVPYSKYYIENNVLDAMKQVLNTLSKPQNITSLEFQSSLTPQISHTETIMRSLQGKEKGSTGLPQSVLEQSFKNCTVDFTFNPNTYSDVIKERSGLFDKFGIDHEFPESESSPQKTLSVLLESSSHYWTLGYRNAASGQLANFREEVFEKTPKNFQWFITECARMLEMNVRDVYDELLRLEEKFQR